MASSVKRLTRYLAFAHAHWQWFENPPEGGFTILLSVDEIRKVEEKMAQELRDKGLPSEWSHIGIVYEDQYGMMLRDAVRFPDGSRGTYIRTVEADGHAPGVVILPMYRKQLLILRQFRHATRTWHLEIPRGFGVAGLTNEENALRELREEIKANVVVPSIVHLGQVHPNTGMTMELVELYYAEVDSYGQAERREAISEIMPVSVEHFEELIRNNEITDGFTLAAYARAKLHGLL